jgi:DNA gyrase subunit A
MEIGTIRPVNIDDQMREAFLDYAMSVIVARALPDARDGLKPVHRRILYVMYDMGLRANTPFKKSARIVGEVLGKYHPHGDGAVYEAMARLAQTFSMRYPLVDGQGNFGSIDGDSPAAMRYTEARMTRLTEELLADLNMNTVDWGDNFDGSLQEPLVLPAIVPNLLVNGATGIAVGMSTNIPPHNLREVAAAVSHMIDHYDHLDDVSVEDLMAFVKGPDFPTGGIILASEEMRSMYATGRGRFLVRAKTHIEEIGKGDRQAIIVTEIPYQLNKTSVIERIAELVKDDKLNEVSDLRDESDRRGMRIVIELKRNAQPLKVLNQLFKHSQLQGSYAMQMLALVDNEPLTIGLKQALKIYIEHRREVIRRRSEFELDRAKARAHILEGYLKALSNLDAVINTIRNAADSEAARADLIKRFDLSDAQAKAILELQLRRIASLERLKIEEEYGEVRKQIDYLTDLLATPRKILALIKSDLNELAQSHGDARRTHIDYETVGDFDEADFVRDEEVLLSITQHGFIKRTPSALYRLQHRGGRGVTGMTTRDEDTVAHLISANSLDHVLFFTSRGKVYALRTYHIPETDRTGKGAIISGLLALEPDEHITAVTPIKDFETGNFVFCTRNAKIKRVSVGEFATAPNRTNGLIAIALEDGDQLQWVKWTSGDNHLLIATAKGQAIRFHEDEVRVMGRAAIGVNAMRLRDDDFIAGIDVIDNAVKEILVITQNGYGKRSSVEEYMLRGRFGVGVRTIDLDALGKTGQIVSAHCLRGNEEITIITREGIAIRTSIEAIRLTSRNTQGVKVIRLSKKDQVVGVAVVESLPDESDGLEHGENGALPHDVLIGDGEDDEPAAAEKDSANGHKPSNPEDNA